MAIANRPARSARRMRVRAGLSLFEVLVAIGILVALAAVSLPWAWSRLAARDLPESAETITALLMLARAEAMSTGRLVEVRVRRGEADASIPNPSMEVRSSYLDPDRLSFEEGSAAELDEAFEFADADQDAPTSQIGASWSRRRLPAGLGLRPIEAGSRREFDVDEFDAAVEFAGSDLIEALDEPERLDVGPLDRAIAIFLPDGSNILAGMWWLEEVPADGVLPDPQDDDRRRMRLSLGDPSGVPRWGELERIVPRGLGEQEPRRAEPPSASGSDRSKERDLGSRGSSVEPRRESRPPSRPEPSAREASNRDEVEPAAESDRDDEDEAKR
jgi:hypothetical protein